jgi:electron transport complex protein RnfD
MSAAAKQPAMSLAARNAWTFAALLPGMAMQFRDAGLPILATLALALAAAFVFESVSLAIRRQPLAPFLREGSSFVPASTLVAWLPAISVLPMLATLFVALVVARQAFGGLGRNLFHPAAVGVGLALWFAPPAAPATDLAFAWLAGGGLLIALRIVRWQSPAFLLAGGAIGLLLGGHSIGSSSHPAWMLAAFFIAGDPVTTPEDPRLRSLAAAATGLLAGLAGAFAPAVLPFALLALNAATPALDAWRPRPRRATQA